MSIKFFTHQDGERFAYTREELRNGTADRERREQYLETLKRQEERNNMEMTIDQWVGILEYIEAEEPEEIDLERVNTMLEALYLQQLMSRGNVPAYLVTVDGEEV